MTKYHLNKHGSPAVCNATVKKCPLGGEHFGSYIEADVAAVNKRRKKTQKDLKRERNIETAKMVGVGVAVIGTFAGFYAGMTHSVNEAQKDYQVTMQKAQHTPYAISVQKVSRREVGDVTITSKDLKQTKLSNCVNKKEFSRNITCSSPDGRMTVKFNAIGKNYFIDGVYTQVKDDAGKITNIKYQETKDGAISNSNMGYVAIPKSAVN